MFVRKKSNKSGSVSVQIINKSNNKYKVVQTIGSSKDKEEIERLFYEGWQIINSSGGKQTHFPFLQTNEEKIIKKFVNDLFNAQIRTIGPELIFGALFNRIGFNIIEDDLFRHITIARLAYPTSKLKTVDYLYRYKGLSISVQTVYRFLDRLNDKYKETVEKIAFEYTKNIIGKITVVFYDMTTLYFESEDEDDLRKIGFSKDGKFQCPQIMLGLIVGENGYPIGYDIFEGNTFEVHTLLPTLEKIQKKYNFKKPIVVADAGLLSKQNIKLLSDNQYQFIIGARIKNETEDIKKNIFKKTNNLNDGDGIILKKPDNTNLIITFSNKRKRKDIHNRERGLKKLRQKVISGKLTKQHITNRGYNKFLTLDGNVNIQVNEEKIKEDKLWDGLKGYITNTELDIETIVNNYKHLWQIEKAFRISKTDLKIRPIYHHIKKRIESHICIAFTAYTIYKELERLLYQHKAGFSPKRATELTHNMYELEYTIPHSINKEKSILKMDEEQKILFDVIYGKNR